MVIDTLIASPPPLNHPRPAQPARTSYFQISPMLSITTSSPSHLHLENSEVEFLTQLPSVRPKGSYPPF